MKESDGSDRKGGIDRKGRTDGNNRTDRKDRADVKGRIDEDDEDYLEMSDSCSATDCTGMLVSGDGRQEELEDYRRIYKFGLPHNNSM